MGSDLLWVFLLGIFVVAVLLWMLFSLRKRPIAPAKDTTKRAPCPLCGSPLAKGERIHSSVTEIGNVEVQTLIKGCPYCLGEKAQRKRSCPVCRKQLDDKMFALALSDPRVDKRKLLLKGCPRCYPEGF